MKGLLPPRRLLLLSSLWEEASARPSLLETKIAISLCEREREPNRAERWSVIRPFGGWRLFYIIQRMASSLISDFLVGQPALKFL